MFLLVKFLQVMKLSLRLLGKVVKGFLTFYIILLLINFLFY